MISFNSQETFFSAKLIFQYVCKKSVNEGAVTISPINNCVTKHESGTREHKWFGRGMKSRVTNKKCLSLASNQ